MIPVLPLRLTFTHAQPARLADYPGGLWRSALGAALRAHACVTRAPTCGGCHLLARCAYGYLFDTPQPRDPAGLTAQYQQLPHPYVLSPRTPGGDRAAGSPAVVDLTLIGPGHGFLPEVLAAARHLRLGRTPLALAGIELLPPLSLQDAPEPVTAAGALEARPRKPEPPPAPARARIALQHPLRMRRRNRYLGAADFDFATFFTTLVRRITMLHALTSEPPLDADPRALAQHARTLPCRAESLQWYDWKRYSARQQRQIPMGGLIGAIHIEGDLTPLWPWLWAGQWLHVGKGAVMGLGCYRLSAA